MSISKHTVNFEVVRVKLFIIIVIILMRYYYEKYKYNKEIFEFSWGKTKLSNLFS